jgi:hypothetical protein
MKMRIWFSVVGLALACGACNGRSVVGNTGTSGAGGAIIGTAGAGGRTSDGAAGDGAATDGATSDGSKGDAAIDGLTNGGDAKPGDASIDGVTTDGVDAKLGDAIGDVTHADAAIDALLGN